MAWTVEIDSAALKDLKKLAKPEQKKLLKAIHRIACLPTPRSSGKPLKGQFGGLWRYRMGNYRIICKIDDSILLILVIAVGHRKDIYKTSH